MEGFALHLIPEDVSSLNRGERVADKCYYAYL